MNAITLNPIDTHATHDPTIGPALEVQWHTHTLFTRYAWRWLAEPLADNGTAVRDAERWTIPLATTNSDAPLHVQRDIMSLPNGIRDRVTLQNSGPARASLSVELDAIIADAPAPQVAHFTIDWQPATAGVRVTVEVDALAAVRPDGADWELSLAPGEAITLEVRLRVQAH